MRQGTQAARFKERGCSGTERCLSLSLNCQQRLQFPIQWGHQQIRSWWAPRRISENFSAAALGSVVVDSSSENDPAQYHLLLQDHSGIRTAGYSAPQERKAVAARADGHQKKWMPGSTRTFLSCNALWKNNVVAR